VAHEFCKREEIEEGKECKNTGVGEETSFFFNRRNEQKKPVWGSGGRTSGGRQNDKMANNRTTWQILRISLNKENKYFGELQQKILEGKLLCARETPRKGFRFKAICPSGKKSSTEN